MVSDIQQLLYFLIDFWSVVTEDYALDATVDGDIHIRVRSPDIVGASSYPGYISRAMSTHLLGGACETVGC